MTIYLNKADVNIKIHKTEPDDLLDFSLRMSQFDGDIRG